MFQDPAEAIRQERVGSDRAAFVDAAEDRAVDEVRAGNPGAKRVDRVGAVVSPAVDSRDGLTFTNVEQDARKGEMCDPPRQQSLTPESAGKGEQQGRTVAEA